MMKRSGSAELCVARTPIKHCKVCTVKYGQPIPRPVKYIVVGDNLLTPAGFEERQEAIRAEVFAIPGVEKPIKKRR